MTLEWWCDISYVMHASNLRGRFHIIIMRFDDITLTTICYTHNYKVTHSFILHVCVCVMCVGVSECVCVYVCMSCDWIDYHNVSYCSNNN